MDKELCVKIAEAIIFSSEKPVSIKQLLHRLPANSDMSYIIEFLMEAKINVIRFVFEYISHNLSSKPVGIVLVKLALHHFGFVDHLLVSEFI